MESLQKSLEHFFETGSHRLARISEHWQRNTNRRTILVLVFAGVIITTLYVSLIQPPRDFPLDTLITIPAGVSLSETASALKDDGIVRSAVTLKILVTVLGHERDVHAGDYLFKEPKNAFSIARAISEGHYGLEPIRIRVVEGATTKEMATLFARNLPRFDEMRFLAAAQKEEGYLFPDTYFFLPNADDRLVLSTLRQSFDIHIAEIQKELDASEKSLNDIVVMASLLEREARTMEDRRKIAGVLWNRIERGMPLQVDAAFLYTVGKSTFELTTEDLASDSPYNTYRYKGLPPGAIGSPSLDSLLATVTPIESDYFYYLADRENVTHYSKTYQEHLRKKKLYLGT